MKDFSKYTGLFKMCVGCSKKEKRDNLKEYEYFCTNRGTVISATTDAMECDEYDGYYLNNLTKYDLKDSTK
ncbi:MAG: hypothetical protein IKY79_03770 [Bacteroidales bacterium]|nr:hypothetical protein [Bacteroidales bacterium]